MKAMIESKGKTKTSTRTKPVPDAAESDSSFENYECPREQIIAEAAYFRAEQRGFAPGNEMSDWLLAEVDVESVLRKFQ